MEASNGILEIEIKSYVIREKLNIEIFVFDNAKVSFLGIIFQIPY
jgi:hypothetical protein